ncbi:MAG: DUF5916 domain-containing protein [Gemmatimonadales bacterium]
MHHRRCLLLLFVLATPPSLASQAPSAPPAEGSDGPSPGAAGKVFQAKRIESGLIRVDGKLDEAAWEQAAWRTDFLDKEPVQGATPSGSTAVAFFYDEHALYIGARMASANPAGIPRSVSRRDQFTDAEHLVIALDTYHDRRTAYSFVISSGGVRSDYYHPSDGEGSRDYTWDPVWDAAVTRDDQGWIAEARIPFSQLRFTAAGTQEWGVQINRWMPRVNEDVYWIVIPQDETGWSSRFGLLEGIEGVKPSRRMELVPYVATNGTFRSATPGDPFEDGSRFTTRAGTDFKMGLGPNLTLDATVNPDFGQVEADPAEVNLSAFETFFSERRPFFTEGAQLLRGNGPNYFYSRRVGQAPRGEASGDFIDRPSNATILGAGKVSGRLRGGTSMAFLTAVTDRETARTYDSASARFGRASIEPLTFYGVGRAQQEFGSSQSVVGVSLTTVERGLGDSGLRSLLARRAITGGADWTLRFRGGAYVVNGFAGMSHVAGSPGAMLAVQQSPAHFMQRPDATEFRLDSTRTSLTGWTAALSASKNAGTHWLWSVGGSAESPLLELNDAGRLQSANDLEASGQLRYREIQPGPLFYRWSTNVFVGKAWNYGGIARGTQASWGNNFTLRNYWRVFVGAFGERPGLNDDLTRGGPLMGNPGSWGGDLNLAGYEASPAYWDLSLNLRRDDAGGWNRSLAGSIRVRPSPAVQISITPRWQRGVSSRQYVEARDSGSAATYGGRYIFAKVDRTTLSAQARVNYAFTPALSLELYAEPFAASGRYFAFGELPRARSYRIRRYGTDGTTVTTQPDGSRVVSDGATSFTIDTRDFNVLSFRSNLVLRWEWHPGSTLFMVWQQDRFGEATRNVGTRSLVDSFGAEGSNFVALKVSYWLAAS